MTRVRIERYDDDEYERRSERGCAKLLLVGCLSRPNAIGRACVFSSFPPSVSASPLA